MSEISIATFSTSPGGVVGWAAGVPLENGMEIISGSLPVGGEVAGQLAAVAFALRLLRPDEPVLFSCHSPEKLVENYRKKVDLLPGMVADYLEGRDVRFEEETFDVPFLSGGKSAAERRNELYPLLFTAKDALFQEMLLLSLPLFFVRIAVCEKGWGTIIQPFHLENHTFGIAQRLLGADSEGCELLSEAVYAALRFFPRRSRALIFCESDEVVPKDNQLFLHETTFFPLLKAPEDCLQLARSAMAALPEDCDG